MNEQDSVANLLPPLQDDHFNVNLSWLLKLRWLAVATQLGTILFVHSVLKVELLWLPPILIIGVTAISNLIASTWLSQRRKCPQKQLGPARGNWVLGCLMILDLLSLAGLLLFTGGPTNPFCIFFFANLCLAAVILPRAWAWGMNVAAVALFIGIMFYYVPLPELEQISTFSTDRPLPSLNLLQAGTIAAFTLCSGVIVYFMTRVTQEMRTKENDLRMAQIRQSQSEKREALGTLAAGAAHELSTPLSTIAVIANDVEYQLSHKGGIPPLVEDIRLIQREVKRCRAILDQMSIDAGQTIGENIASISLPEITDRALSELPESERVHISLPQSPETLTLKLPINAVAQALRSLIKNALDASAPDSPVEVRVGLTDEWLTWQVIDHGVGMAPSVLRRLSEPFFSTKPPGKGTGLGIYLARSIIEKLDGTIEFESEPYKGTIASLRLPRSLVKSLHASDK